MRIVKNEEVANKAAEKSTKDTDKKRQSIVIQSDEDDEPSVLNLLGSLFPENRTNEKTRHIKIKTSLEKLTLQVQCEDKLREAV